MITRRRIYRFRDVEGWNIATLTTALVANVILPLQPETPFAHHKAAMSSPKEFLAEEVLVEKKVVSSDTAADLWTI